MFNVYFKLLYRNNEYLYYGHHSAITDFLSWSSQKPASPLVCESPTDIIFWLNHASDSFGVNFERITVYNFDTDRRLELHVSVHESDV